MKHVAILTLPLVLAAGALAQAPPGPPQPGVTTEPEAIQEAVFVLEVQNGADAHPVDASAIERTARACLAKAKVNLIAQGKDATGLVPWMRIRVQTERTEGGFTTCTVVVRLEPAPLPGTPVLAPIRQAQRLFGRKNADGFQDHAVRLLTEALSWVAKPPVEPREVPAPTRVYEAPVGAAAGTLAPMSVAGTLPPGSPAGKVADVDFQQMKIRLQPPPPPYPLAAKLMRVQGTVTVAITVDTDGSPMEVEAISGPPALQEAAMRYAQTWDFEPSVLNGKPQRARFYLTMPFRLR